MPTRRLVLAATSAGLALCCAGTGVVASASTAPAKRYSNCTALNRVYPHGVGRSGAHDHTRSGRNPVTNFTRNTRVYNANTARDRDKDGIACEKH